jgi:hypothetical protein
MIPLAYAGVTDLTSHYRRFSRQESPFCNKTRPELVKNFRFAASLLNLASDSKRDNRNVASHSYQSKNEGVEYDQ